MTTNFNNFGDDRPSDLTSFLIDELIQLYGVPFYYIKKTFVNLDKLFGEDDLAEYKDAYLFYMLPENPESYGGGGDSFGAWNWEILDTFQVYIEIKRFQELTGLDEPQDQDFCYSPVLKKWFEISYSTDEGGRGGSSAPYFWNGKQGAFLLSLSALRASHETIDTGIEEIDDNLPFNQNQTETDNDVLADELNENLLTDELDDLLKKKVK